MSKIMNTKYKLKWREVRDMNNSHGVLNHLLVKLFNDILRIEENSLKKSLTLGDLSVTEMHTIEAIGAKEERTMSEVANDLGITVGTLTTAINKLIKKEYVERRRIEEDRRVVLIKTTEKGIEVYKLHEKFHDDMIKDTIDDLNTEESQVLVSALKRISDFFEEKYHLIHRK